MEHTETRSEEKSPPRASPLFDPCDLCGERLGSVERLSLTPPSLRRLWLPSPRRRETREWQREAPPGAERLLSRAEGLGGLRSPTSRPRRAGCLRQNALA